ncbi:alpha/beta hydrolase [Deltaproteobacteria bacterium TL4]
MKKNGLNKKYIKTSYANIAYLETGSKDKPPVLLIHGIPTSGYLWRDVIQGMAHDYHCYAPDLMGLGDTEVDPKTGLFHMEAQAKMLAEFMTVLGHEEFIMICHDQGGAAAQIIAARFPERILRFVITSCVCFDNWPVPVISRLQNLARLPFLTEAIGKTGLFEFVEKHTLFSSFSKGVYRKGGMNPASIEEYFRPLKSSAVSRKCFIKFLLAGNPRYTLRVVKDLRYFRKPTMILWSKNDVYLPPAWADDLARLIPGTRHFEIVSEAGHFWQEEKAEEFTLKILDFLAKDFSQRTSPYR